MPLSPGAAVVGAVTVSNVVDVEGTVTALLTNVWTETQTSGDNAQQTVTRAAVLGQIHRITAIEVVIKGAAAGADIDIELRDGATVLWSEVIGDAALVGTRVGISFSHPVQCTANTAANLVVDAGGQAGCLTVASMSGYTS